MPRLDSTTASVDTNDAGGCDGSAQPSGRRQTGGPPWKAITGQKMVTTFTYSDWTPNSFVMTHASGSDANSLEADDDLTYTKTAMPAKARRSRTVRVEHNKPGRRVPPSIRAARAGARLVEASGVSRARPRLGSRAGPTCRTSSSKECAMRIPRTLHFVVWMLLAVALAVPLVAQNSDQMSYAAMASSKFGTMPSCPPA